MGRQFLADVVEALEVVTPGGVRALHLAGRARLVDAMQIRDARRTGLGGCGHQNPERLMLA